MAHTKSFHIGSEVVQKGACTVPEDIVDRHTAAELTVRYLRKKTVHTMSFRTALELVSEWSAEVVRQALDIRG